MNSKIWIAIAAAIIVIGGGTWAVTSLNKPADKMMSADEVAAAVAYALSRPADVALENIMLTNLAGDL